MTKQQKYSIHQDFLHFPTITFSFNVLVIGLINLLLRCERLLRQHRVIRAATKHAVITRDGHHLKILQMNPATSAQPAPAVIYFHGGAYALTYASSHVYSVDWYARHADCTVFLVDYRLSHRHPFPTGFNDCCAALTWVTNHATELGIDRDRIVLMGDSAGGGLAAGVSQWALDQQATEQPDQQQIPLPVRSASADSTAAMRTPVVRAQVLIYPTLDKSCSTESALQFHDVPLWNALSNRAMWSAYLRTVGNAVPTYAAPADRATLSNLPPAYIETAEFDPLRDEGIAYAERLKHAGVATQLVETEQTIHGFDTVFTSAITQHSLDQRRQFLHSVFYPEPVTDSVVKKHPSNQPPTATVAHATCPT